MVENKKEMERTELHRTIWAIADELVGTIKSHEYGNITLPMCVIKQNN